MMRFISFSSGSCGNCYLLLGPSSGILIDAGVGIRRVKKEMDALGLEYENISAILVTHDTETISAPWDLSARGLSRLFGLPPSFRTPLCAIPSPVTG
ncbi:MAG: MBL fold metallo-hydrolase [Bacteroidales bacterium]|nr:MBL fold metallo-hydrolase [Bacteroidales bacterium]